MNLGCSNTNYRSEDGLRNECETSDTKLKTWKSFENILNKKIFHLKDKSRIFVGLILFLIASLLKE